MRASHNITWPICCEGQAFESEAAISHGVVGLPSFYLVDRKGMLRATPVVSQLASELQKLLAE